MVRALLAPPEGPRTVPIGTFAPNAMQGLLVLYPKMSLVGPLRGHPPLDAIEETAARFSRLLVDGFRARPVRLDGSVFLRS